MNKLIKFGVVDLLDFIIKLLARHPSTHKFLLMPGIEPLRWRLGWWRAWRTFEMSSARVPGYGEFLKRHKKKPTLSYLGSIEQNFKTIPEMDKQSYIKKWSILERSIDGRLPKRGVVVDESSGSSGTPTSWVRGPEERAATRQLLQVGFARSAQQLNKQPFVINAFSLGAWATGMNVTTSLADFTMIKSIGPDKDKIVATMLEFGPNYTYIILSYPPFLKSLFDDTRVKWEDYIIVLAFGGEGISENMRAHLNKYAHTVLGSYGASDLEINIAIETDFTVALRQAIAKSPKLSKELTKQSEYGVLPMIFQFNPFDYIIETNPKGELLVTIARKQNINPRIRYNIHDRGHVVRLKDLLPILEEHGLNTVIRQKFLDLPLVFHYGRSDMSVDFNGAVVAPDGLRDVIFGDDGLIEAVENHRLISFEDKKGDKQLHIALQLKQGRKKGRVDTNKYYDYVFSELRKLNTDFDHAILTSGDSMLPSISFYDFRTGPFAEDGKKLKNEYVWNITAAEKETWNLNESHHATK
ncbi:CoF synthetase [Candidatus Saccharibacteria bacterium]|nr:CoF synthetase [Candidatus Saccharibacteria bacterium]